MKNFHAGFSPEGSPPPPVDPEFNYFLHIRCSKHWFASFKEGKKNLHLKYQKTLLAIFINGMQLSESTLSGVRFALGVLLKPFFFLLKLELLFKKSVRPTASDLLAGKDDKQNLVARTHGTCLIPQLWVSRAFPKLSRACAGHEELAAGAPPAVHHRHLLRTCFLVHSCG